MIQEGVLLSEKYRPKIIDECILPQSTKNIFEDFIKSKNIPNLLLCGAQGIGKTTVALVLCSQLGFTKLLINGSNEGRLIDTLRTKITDFSSCVSLNGKKKVVIIDEADYSNKDSVMPALRNFMEEFSNNTRFILTCNFKNRIIEPLHSRCSIIDFNIEKGDRPELAFKFLSRIKFILDSENIKYDEKILIKIIMEYFPDFRRVINEIQKYSSGGEITTEILSNTSDTKTKKILSHLKKKEFTEARKWVSNNLNNDSSILFRSIYDVLHDHLVPSSIPQSILILAEYQYKSNFVADQEINFMACLTELMCECKFKE